MRPGQKKPSYSDSLVEISSSEILFRRYYFPIGAKRVPLAEIESIEIVRHPRFGERWRLHGSNDLRTWYPCDWRRPWRDTQFVVTQRNQWRRIAFTVEDSRPVEDVLRRLGVRTTLRH